MRYTFRNYISVFSHPAHGSGFSAWFRLLWANRFAIHPAFIIKVLFISCTVIISTPFRWFEGIRFRKAISGIKVKSPVFILGHPRSGTTFLHYLLSKDPAFAYCTTVQAMLPHLFLTGSKIFPAFLSKVLPKKRPMDDLKLGALLPKEEEFALASIGPESLVSGYYFPKNFLNNFSRHVVFESGDKKAEENWKKNLLYFLRKLSFVNPGKKLLLKSPGNTGRIRQILELFPDARFIHIARNPYDVYQSNMHLYRKLLPLLSFQHVKVEQVEGFVLESYKKLMKNYFRDKNLIRPEHLAEIRYEDFILQPLECLESVYKKLGLENFPQAGPLIQEELKNYSGYRKNIFEMGEPEKERIAAQWQFAFEKLHYTP